MSDPLANVSAGQRVRRSASRENTLTAVARKVLYPGASAGGGGGGLFSTPDTVVIENASDATIDAGQAFTFDELVFAPEDGKPVPMVAFKTAEPTAELVWRRKVAIAAEPLNAGNALGRAHVNGFFPAKVNISDAKHGFAAVSIDEADDSDDGSSSTAAPALVSLVSANAGEYRIIGRSKPAGDGSGSAESSDDGTGERWVILCPAYGTLFKLKLFDVADGKGNYLARLYGVISEPIWAADDFGDVHLGELPTENDCVFQNIEEAGAGTHVLKPESGSVTGRAIGWYAGIDPDTGNVLIQGYSLTVGGCAVPPGGSDDTGS